MVNVICVAIAGNAASRPAASARVAFIIFDLVALERTADNRVRQEGEAFIENPFCDVETLRRFLGFRSPATSGEWRGGSGGRKGCP